MYILSSGMKTLKCEALLVNSFSLQRGPTVEKMSLRAPFHVDEWRVMGRAPVVQNHPALLNFGG